MNVTIGMLKINVVVIKIKRIRNALKLFIVPRLFASTFKNTDTMFQNDVTSVSAKDWVKYKDKLGYQC